MVFWVDSSLFLALEKCCYSLSGLHVFSWEIEYYFNFFSRIAKSCFSLRWIFSLSLVLWNLIIMCLDTDVFKFIMFRVCSTSWILDLCLFPSLGNFQTFWECIFSLIFFLLSWCCDDMNVGIFAVVPQILRLFIFFNMFSLCFSDWVISIVLSSSSWFSLLSSLSCCWAIQVS